MPINTPTSDTEEGAALLRRDHPVLHPHLRYGDRLAQMVNNVRAAHEGYSGLEDDGDEEPAEQFLPRRRIEQTLRSQREEQEEMLRGWASL